MGNLIRKQNVNNGARDFWVFAPRLCRAIAVVRRDYQEVTSLRVHVFDMTRSYGWYDNSYIRTWHSSFTNMWGPHSQEYPTCSELQCVAACVHAKWRMRDAKLESSQPMALRPRFNGGKRVCQQLSLKKRPVPRKTCFKWKDQYCLIIPAPRWPC